MNLKEMKAKTGWQVIGIVDALQSYFSEKKGVTYYSVDLIIRGLKEKLNVRLPAKYDLAKIKEDELIKLDLCLDRYGNYEAIVSQ